VVRLTGVADGFQELSTAMEEMNQGTDIKQEALVMMLESSKHVDDLGFHVADMINKLSSIYEELHAISEEAQAIL